MIRVTILLAVCGGATALGQSYNNNLNPLGGPAQLQVNMNPNWTPALGDGRGLERDFSGMGLGNYNRRDFTGEMRIRNNVISNNAFNGGYSGGYTGGAIGANTNRYYGVGANHLAANTSRSYTSTGTSYRGTLGADDLFSFRRDSFANGAATLGVRGTESLQYLYGYSTANKFAIPSAVPTDNPGPGAPQGYGPVPTAIQTWQPPSIPTVTVDDFSGLGNGWSEVAPKFGTLRSTSSFTSTRALNPSVIGVNQDAGGITESLTASPLLGVRAAPSRRSDRIDLSVNRAIDPTTGKPVVDPLGAALNAKPDAVKTTGSETRLRTAYDELLERYAQADGLPPLTDTKADDPTPIWQARLNKLREQLEAMEAARLNDEADLTGNAAPKGPASREESLKARREASSLLDPETLRLIRQAGGEAKTYADLGGHEREMYAKYMETGAKAMAENRFFDAEEQFVRCLSIAPGDPTVSAARVNAQVGAALFLSAALNAKALFEAHPEVIGVRYTGGTIPSAERLATLAAMLRERVSDSRKIKLPPPRDAAFLLAYIGFQLGDAAMTREGLDMLDETFADHPEPLVPVIRGVWLEDK